MELLKAYAEPISVGRANRVEDERKGHCWAGLEPNSNPISISATDRFTPDGSCGELPLGYPGNQHTLNDANRAFQAILNGLEQLDIIVDP